MKTAISVEDSLMEQADNTARDLGLSRSGLITQALRDYLQRRRRDLISDRLNQVYANEPSADERQTVRKLRTKIHKPDRW